MLNSTKVGSAMRSPFITAVPQDTILSVAQKMIENDIGAVVVVENDKPVGLITERDIVEGILKWYNRLSESNAKDIMSSPILSIEEDKTIGEALDFMRKKGVRRLGVTRKHKLVGIVTERRLLDVIRKTLKTLVENI